MLFCSAFCRCGQYSNETTPAESSVENIETSKMKIVTIEVKNDCQINHRERGKINVTASSRERNINKTEFPWMRGIFLEHLLDRREVMKDSSGVRITNKNP